MQKDNKNTFSLRYIDSFKEDHLIQFYRHEYNNLMVLLWDRTIEDWGDCKGRAWCGTCHIKVASVQHLLIEYDSEENHCLSNQENRISNSRLACQLELNELLDGAVIEYLGDT